MIRSLLIGFASIAVSAAALGQSPNTSGTFGLLVSLPGQTPYIRVEVSVAEFDCEKLSDQFLDHWFEYFDRDANGALSAAEVARAIPLPSSTGKEIVLEFSAANANKDGELSRHEFKTALRAAGFTSVVARVQPTDPLVKQRHDALLRYLDRSGKGSLTRGNLERAIDVLRRFDDNKDEVVDAAELLIGAPKIEVPKSVGSLMSSLRIVAAQPDRPVDSVLRLPLSAPTSAAALVGSPDSLVQARVRVDCRNLAWTGPARTARLFCLAQFDNLLGERPHVERKQVERDPAARLLLALFDPADRDGDGRLSGAELRRFLDLIEEGASSQLVVTFEDRGQNLFDILDVNGDARLDFRELLDAPKRFPAIDPTQAIAIPMSLHVTVQRGAAAPSFGPLPLAVAPPPSAIAVERVRKGPRWFQALDHNQDGFVSPLEFVGPAQAFHRLDANGDGLVSADEAGFADAQTSKAK